MEPKDKIIIVQYTTICDLKKQIQILKEQLALSENNSNSKCNSFQSGKYNRVIL